MTEPADPRLSQEDLEILARMRQVVAEAKAAGTYDTEPIENPEKFEGPIGADNSGHITTYASVEELRRAKGETP